MLQWKLLWVAILVAVLSTHHADANYERNKRAIRNDYQIPNLPIHSSLKEQDAIVIESNFLGYEYTTPKPTGYVYTRGYVYVTPNVTILTPTSTTTTTTKKPSTPGTDYLPPTTTLSTTTTTITTTPSTTTTTTTTTPSTTTTTFKPTYLPPYERTYLPPPRKYLPVRPTPIPYPTIRYETIRTSSITPRTFKPFHTPAPPPTLPPSTTRAVLIRGYEYLPPKEYLPAFKTRK
ncbi:coiled-coil domain-containing protein 80-like [Polyergus mexicanus]|uniref:coiled-coil domain-containing protein 80-like n=1 Tax=Polyergus mexicanus TaxID=615972 RepID=UPI0038B4EC2F